MNPSTVVSAELQDTLRQTPLMLDMPNTVENILNKKTINLFHIFFGGNTLIWEK